MDKLFLVFNISLAVTVFCYGLTAQHFNDIRYMWQHPRLTLLSLIAMYILTPVLGLVLAETIDMPIPAKVAIVAISLSMIPPLLPQKELQAGGHGSYGIGLVIVTALLAPVGIPALVAFLGKLMNRPYGVSPIHIGVIVLELVIAPLVAGVLVGWLLPQRITAPVQKHAPKVASTLTLVALVLLLIAVAPVIWKGATAWILLAGVLFNVGGLAIGHLMAGPNRVHAVVLALSCASRHPAIAFTIARESYPGKNIAAAAITVLVLNGIICGWYVKWQRKRTGSAAEQAPSSS
ncbi:hypothetical protein ACFVVP_26885 [Streptomyces sp. NPDC058128]|uniref:hypothetical protein n=1 Tax=Streptomyces sp. NPDC058128 TaxID=3346352 RepID=UPI0036EDED1E